MRVDGGAPVSLPAKLDSGATTSVMPQPIAVQIGIGTQHMRPGGGARSAGGALSTWQSTLPVTVQVAANQQGTDNAGFGPEITLEGFVSPVNNLLLGQRDFFNEFSVTFERGTRRPLFVLEQ